MSSPHPRPSLPTVLVVDDEDIPRRVTARALTEKGYFVLMAHDGREAWELLQQAHEIVEAVVTDVRMPNLGGLELADLVATLPNAPPVILISGYGPDKLSVGLPFLAKPFRPDQLVALVAQVLETSRPKH